MAPPASPLYVQIQEFLREGIRTQRFNEGDRLPSETEIARRFATTRATVARALQQLSYEGLISRRMGSGTFVGGNAGGLHDTVNLSGVLGQDERLLAAGEELTYEVTAFAPGTADAAAASRLQCEPGTPVWRLERIRKSAGSVIGVERRVVTEPTASLIQPEWLAAHPIQEVLTRCLGIRIGRIENVVRATVAGAGNAKLFGCARNESLLAREHVIYDAKGQAVLCGETTYRPGFSIAYAQQARR